MVALHRHGHRPYQPRAVVGVFPAVGVASGGLAARLAKRAEPYLVRRLGLAGGVVGRYRRAPVVAQPGDRQERRQL